MAFVLFTSCSKTTMTEVEVKPIQVKIDTNVTLDKNANIGGKNNSIIFTDIVSLLAKKQMELYMLCSYYYDKNKHWPKDVAQLLEWSKLYFKKDFDFNGLNIKFQIVDNSLFITIADGETKTEMTIFPANVELKEKNLDNNGKNKDVTPNQIEEK